MPISQPYAPQFGIHLPIWFVAMLRACISAGVSFGDAGYCSSCGRPRWRLWHCFRRGAVAFEGVSGVGVDLGQCAATAADGDTQAAAGRPILRVQRVGARRGGGDLDQLNTVTAVALCVVGCLRLRSGLLVWRRS